MSCDPAYWDERIEKIKTAIAAYEDAIIFFAENGAAAVYRLDTGQTTTMVQRGEIGSMKNTLKTLYSLLDDLCARTGGATNIIVPVR